MFARQADDALASLVKQLDKIVADNDDQKLASVVNLLGDDADSLQATAKEFAAAHKLQHVAVAVPNDHVTGPPGMKLSPEAGLTVMLYRGKEVKANHALPPGGLDQARADAIVADVAKILE